MRHRLAVIGGGPRALNVLERLLARPSLHGSIEVTVFEPGVLGPGVHGASRGDHLWLNTVAGELTTWTDREMVGRCRGIAAGPTFLDWARDREVHVERHGTSRPVAFGDYVARHLLADYLAEQAHALVTRLSQTMPIRHVAATVVAARRQGDGWVVETDDGASLPAGHVALASGHGPHGTHLGDAWRGLEASGPGDVVAVVGAGLSAVDLVAAATSARGGTFRRSRAGRLDYHPSGEEPVLVLTSRSGTLPCARPVVASSFPAPRTGLDDAALERLASAGNFAEALRAMVRSEIAGPLTGADQDHVLQVLEPRARWSDEDAHRAGVVTHFVRDLTEAQRGPASPVKQRLEVLRAHRDFLRRAAELAPDGAGHAYVFGSLASVANRAVVGPPAERAEELSSLLRAGLLRLGPGPSPDITEERRGLLLRSTRLDVASSTLVDRVLDARSERASPRRGVVPPLLRTGISARLASDGNVVGPGNAWLGAGVVGPPAEGSSYYNHYVTSPGAPSRCLSDIDAQLDGVETALSERLLHEGATS